MGTWGYGPLENDTALDLLRDMASQPRQATSIIKGVLTRLTDMKTDQDVGELREAMTRALAACGVIADRRMNEYLYVPAPEYADDFAFCMVKCDDGLVALAREVLEIYRTAERHRIDLGWDDPASYQHHRRMLHEMDRRISRSS